MINDVEQLLMDVCGCAVWQSGLSEMAGHRSKRCYEALRAVFIASK